MSALSKLLNPSYPIVIAQYKRDDYGVGSEQYLHWALIVLTSKEELEGHCFQAVDRHYSDGRGTVWEPHYTPSASLRKTTKCLGGVQIGSVKARKLDALVMLVRAHPTTPKFEGWNCRDWILEVVELLATEGWINKSFVASGEDPQARLLIDFRKVSQNTVARSQDEFNPDVQWIQWYVRASSETWSQLTVRDIRFISLLYSSPYCLVLH